MKSIPGLTIIVLLFFACKLCSFTGTKRPPFSSPSPSPSQQPLKYAADFLKQKLGSFTLVKHRTREEMQKGSEGFASTILQRSNDAGIAEYRSETSQSVSLWVISFPSPDVAASTFDEFEKDMKGSYRWRGVRTTTTQRGKRIEGIDSKARGVVIWTNGYWLFMTSARSGLSDASSLADSVGY
jgi:hypothetical protein